MLVYWNGKIFNHDVVFEGRVVEQLGSAYNVNVTRIFEKNYQYWNQSDSDVFELVPTAVCFKRK